MKKMLSILFLLCRKERIVCILCSMFCVLSLIMPVGIAVGSEPVSSSNPGPIIGDALFHSPKLTRRWSKEPARAPARAPGKFRETSEYMIGRIAVGIILPESNGSIDSPQTENWTSSEENAVKSEIQAGLNWWVAREPAARLEFITDFHFRVPTGYEPIGHPQTDEGLWISEVMTNLGYPGTDYMDQVYEYNNALREKQGADWAYTIFVVDSSADGDGKFSDGYFAYAWVGGPFLMLTYDNNGYGISNLDAVCAHETGHIFYALNQYAESSCSPTETSGYLAAPNSNCENGGTSYECIMRGKVSPYTRGKISVSAREQIGWRDSDSDGILDIVDINPETSLTPFSPDPTENPTPTYTGSAQTGTPFPNNNPYNPYGSGRSDININIISGVESRYRLNVGNWSEWSAAAPADGNFDGEKEDFTFTPSPLTQGTYDFEVRALNRFGNADLSPAADQLTINGEDLSPTCTLIQPESLTWYNGAITLSALAGDSDGVVTQVEFDYSLNGSTWYSCAGSPVTTSPYNLSWESLPVGEVNEGVSLRARARDNQGLYSEYSQVQIKVDNKAPTFSNWLNTPADLTEDVVGSFQVQVEIVDEGIGLEGEAPGLDYRIGTNPFDGYETMTLSGGNTWIFTISEPVDGWENYGSKYLEYKVQANDDLGNTAVSQVRQEFIDEINFPPTVSLTSPQSLTWNHGSINLVAEASDPDGSIAQVEFFYSLDGLIWYLCPGGVDTAYPYAVSWASLPAEGVDESIGLRVRAKDNEGLYSTYDEIQIKVDNASPIISNWIQVPEDLTADHSGPFRIMVAVSDQGFGLSNQVPGLDYRLGSLSFDGYEEMTSAGGSTWFFDIQEPESGWEGYRGKYLTYQVKASDGVGNTTLSDPYQELIDGVNLPPVCELTMPAPLVWYAGMIPLLAEANDSDGTIVQVEFAYSFDQATWYPVPGSPATASPYRLTWLPSVQTEGDAFIRARARDNEGLYSAYHSIQIMLDNKPPALSNWITVPSDLTADYEGFFQIKVEAVDGGSGLTAGGVKIDYRIGSGEFSEYQAMTSGGGNTWVFNIAEPLEGWSSHGNEYLEYRIMATDALNNEATGDLMVELIDGINWLAPACRITSPLSLDWYAGLISLSAEANDPDGAIVQVEFAYSPDGFTWYPVAGSPDLSYPYSLVWDTRQIINETNQSVRIRSRALDSQGLYSTYSEITIKVDNEAPEFSDWDSTPADLTADYTGAFRISVAVLDDGVGLLKTPKIDYRLSSGSFSGYQDMFSGGNNTWLFNISEPLEGWGTYANEYLEYRVTGQDGLGNVTTSDLRSEFIQARQTPPQCRLISPAAFGWYAGSINLMAEASSSNGNILQVEFAYSQDGLTWHECDGSPVSASPYSLVWQTVPSDGVDSRVYLRARSLDSTGAYSDWDMIEVRIDNQPPVFQSFTHTPDILTNNSTGNVVVEVGILETGSDLEFPGWDWRIGEDAYTGYKQMDFRASGLYTGVIPEPAQGWRAYAGEYVYYRIKASDRAGNTAFSPEQMIPIQATEQIPPVLDWVAAKESEADIHFQEESLPLDLSEASFLIFETDNPDNVLTLFNPVLDQIDQALVHLPLTRFKGGITYTLKIEGVKDVVGNRIPSALEREFIPVFPDQVTEVVKEDGTGLKIDPGTFNEVVSLEIDLDPQIPFLQQEVGKKTPGASELIPETYRKYEARGTDGALLGKDDFNHPVRIQIPYPETEEETDLRIYYLDEVKSQWVELAGEQEIDHNSHLIVASAPHFSLFCIARLASPPVEPPTVEDFIVYPNPFRGPDGHTSLNFKGPGEQARIRLFSVSGQLVKELRGEDWEKEEEGIWSWEVEPDLANGLYIYLILDNGTKKVGKLAIVR